MNQNFDYIVDYIEPRIMVALIVLSVPLWLPFFFVLGLFQRNVFGSEPTETKACSCWILPQFGCLGDKK